MNNPFSQLPRHLFKNKFNHHNVNLNFVMNGRLFQLPRHLWRGMMIESTRPLAQIEMNRAKAREEILFFYPRPEGRGY